MILVSWSIGVLNEQAAVKEITIWERAVFKKLRCLKWTTILLEVLLALRMEILPLKELGPMPEIS